MTDVIVVGAGGHAAEIDEYICYGSKKSRFKVIGFIDDNETSYNKYQFSAPYLGNIKDHDIQNDKYYIIGIANLSYRKSIVANLLGKGARFVTFIHDIAYVSPSAKIGVGVVIAPYANVGPNVVIGDFTLLNARTSIGHDSIVGSHNFISPNVSLSGHTSIGDENLFGINSATIPGVQIGSRNKIAAGMVVDLTVKDDSVIFHRFKEKVIAIQKP
jgi:sugar O-acyltransferase (sialic acid O-acetyltransferase NeuD family)